MTEPTSNQNPEVPTNVSDSNVASRSESIESKLGNALGANAVAPNPAEQNSASASAKPKGSYVKLAMRNMVRKGRQSLWHFFLTTVGLVGVLVGLAYLTKP